MGTFLNGLAILAGAAAGLSSCRELSPQRQKNLRILCGAFAVWLGFVLIWHGIASPFGRGLKQFGLVLIALMLGRLIGGWFRLQSHVNRLGRYARESLEGASKLGAVRSFSAGFLPCTVLFCVEPLALLGAVSEGLRGEPRVLILKAVMDGVAAMAMARSLGWGVGASALPVVVYQGTLALVSRGLLPWLDACELTDTLAMTCGVVLLAVSLVILELKRIELTNYLPGLVLAPLLYFVFK
jgi:uncharacterized membrane protein YqgA involved in biofilm formation